MQAKLVSRLPRGNGWSYELKLDGYRALALKRGDVVHLLSRNRKPLTAYPEVIKAIQRLSCGEAMLDWLGPLRLNRWRPSLRHAASNLATTSVLPTIPR